MDVADEVLAKDRSLEALRTVVWELAAGDAGDALDRLFKETDDLERQAVILSEILYEGRFEAFPLVERTLTQTWRARHSKPDGTTGFFLEPRLEWYAFSKFADISDDFEELLLGILKDPAYLAAYRAFLSASLPWNASRSFLPLMRDLLDDDIPPTLRKALSKSIETLQR